MLFKPFPAVGKEVHTQPYPATLVIGKSRKNKIDGILTVSDVFLTEKHDPIKIVR